MPGGGVKDPFGHVHAHLRRKIPRLPVRWIRSPQVRCIAAHSQSRVLANKETARGRGSLSLCRRVRRDRVESPAGRRCRHVGAQLATRWSPAACNGGIPVRHGRLFQDSATALWRLSTQGIRKTKTRDYAKVFLTTKLVIRGPSTSGTQPCRTRMHPRIRMASWTSRGIRRCCRRFQASFSDRC